MPKKEERRIKLYRHVNTFTAAHTLHVGHDDHGVLPLKFDPSNGYLNGAYYDAAIADATVKFNIGKGKISFETEPHIVVYNSDVHGPEEQQHFVEPGEVEIAGGAEQGVTFSAPVITAGTGTLTLDPATSLTQPDDSTVSLVDINTATAEQLEDVDGIGGKTSEKIVALRAESPFADMADAENRLDLMPALWTRIKDHICVLPVGGTDEPPTPDEDDLSAITS